MDYVKKQRRKYWEGVGVGQLPPRDKIAEFSGQLNLFAGQ